MRVGVFVASLCWCPLILFTGTAVGYKFGAENAAIEYVAVPGPERIVKEPYEVRGEVPVPGPERIVKEPYKVRVEVPVPGPTLVKKIAVPTPRYCPAAPSVADALNEYEAINRRRGT